MSSINVEDPLKLKLLVVLRVISLGRHFLGDRLLKYLLSCAVIFVNLRLEVFSMKKY